jgi:cold shock CspA family protein
MTVGVICTLNAMFGTKFGHILVAGEDRECYFDRASLLTPEDFEHLRYGSKVEFDEEADRTHGRRAVRIVVIHDESNPVEGQL